ncbi:imelysin family protein [Piscinibacter sp.]|uniref:imelysin family protein n=1 Tax=Piscinibacter sp. TaxID=1903157 RepID=UPI0039E4A3A3
MQKIARRQLLWSLGAVPLALAGCGGGDSSDSGSQGFNAKPMVDNIVDNVIVQTYSNLNTQAGLLLTAVTTLRAAPNDANLDAAQAQWRATRVPWESSEGFLIGPVTGGELGIDGAIDTWPLDTPSLVGFLATNPNPTVPQIEDAPDDLRGFHAIEYVLFGDGVNTNDKVASSLTEPELNYLVALAQALKNRTQALADAWTKPYNNRTISYAAQLKTPGTSNSVHTGYAGVLGALVDGLSTIADEVGNAKLADPLGDTLAQADTSLVESQYSWNSLTDFHNNIQSILNVYTGVLGFSGTAPSASATGLYTFVAERNATLATRVFNEIVNAQKKIALIKGDGNDTTTVISGSAQPFRVQIGTTAGRALITTAIGACNTLQATLQNDVKPLVASTMFA